MHPIDFLAVGTLLCNGSALRKANRRLTQLYDAALAPCGLSSSQRSVLLQLHICPSSTMSTLAHLLVLDRSTLARNIQPLQSAGFVEQRPDERDRRSRRVSLTPSGYEKLAESHPLWRAAQERFEAVYGNDRSAELRVALMEIYSEAFADAYRGSRS